MGTTGTIICFGGGGFTHDADPALEDDCLALLPDRPKIGYMGWANADDPLRIARFHRRFGAVAGEASHLPMGADAKALAGWLADKDMVYLGGGNTARLLAELRHVDKAAHFAAALAGGCLVAGVSAGGVCWFDWILSDAGGHGPTPIAGLGLVGAGICPHYDSEPLRAPLFARACAERPALPAFCVDDGAGLVVRGGEVVGQISARPQAAAYRLQTTGEQITPVPLAPFTPTAH